jgi:hypothetical protein
VVIKESWRYDKRVRKKETGSAPPEVLAGQVKVNVSYLGEFHTLVYKFGVAALGGG